MYIAPSSTLPKGEAQVATTPAPRAPLPATPGAAPATLRTSATTLALSLGQVLGATVVRGGEAGSAVALKVAGQTIEARTTLGLSAGQRLDLSVAKTGPQTVLQILDPVATAKAVASEGLRTALPRSAPLPDVFAALAKALPREGGDAVQHLPPQVREAARALVALLPDRGRLQVPEGLREALQNSGLFMESRAVRQPPGSPLPPGDVKAALMKLATAIREQMPAPPAATARPAGGGEPTALARSAGADDVRSELATLARATEGAVYRVQSQQLQQAARNAEQPGVLAVEVPVRNEQRTDVLKLRVDEEGRRRGGEAEGSAWQVVLDLDLGAAGPFQAHVTLRGDTVSAMLRIADTGTATDAKTRLHELATRLAEAGLEVGTLACLNSAPLPEPEAEVDTGSLIEVEA